jgi:hypothetical protein
VGAATGFAVAVGFGVGVTPAAGVGVGGRLVAVGATVGADAVGGSTTTIVAVGSEEMSSSPPPHATKKTVISPKATNFNEVHRALVITNLLDMPTS